MSEEDISFRRLLHELWSSQEEMLLPWGRLHAAACPGTAGLCSPWVPFPGWGMRSAPPQQQVEGAGGALGVNPSQFGAVQCTQSEWGWVQDGCWRLSELCWLLLVLGAEQ